MANRLFLPAISIALAITSQAGGYAADATVVKFSGSGASAPSEMDINNDGIKGFLTTGTGNSVFGLFTTVNMNEAGAPVGANTENCPGAVEVPLIVVNTVFTFQDGSQFFEKLVSGYFCFNQDDSFTLVAKTQVIGGIGRFAGMTGTIDTTAKGSVILKQGEGLAAKPLLSQQSFEGTLTITPKQP
jgi:hypothetical protein